MNTPNMITLKRRQRESRDTCELSDPSFHSARNRFLCDVVNDFLIPIFLSLPIPTGAYARLEVSGDDYLRAGACDAR